MLKHAVQVVGADVYLQREGPDRASPTAQMIGGLTQRIFGEQHVPDGDVLARTELAKQLSIRFVENTTVMELQHAHPDPALAQSTLEAVLDGFMIKRRQIYRDSSLPLMREKLQQVSLELDIAEAALQDFNRDNQVTSVGDESTALLLSLIHI